jgi:hypothetical protein
MKRPVAIRSTSVGRERLATLCSHLPPEKASCPIEENNTQAQHEIEFFEHR